MSAETRNKFWSLENQKTRFQSFITVCFYSFILSLMDSIILFPFQSSLNSDMAWLEDGIRDYPPSFLFGVIIIIMVMSGRYISNRKRVTTVIFSLICGLLFSGFMAILPLYYLLRKPTVADGNMETMAPQGPVIIDEQEEVTVIEEAPKDHLIHEKKPDTPSSTAIDSKPETVTVETATADMPATEKIEVDSAEIENSEDGDDQDDEYNDPLAEFINKKD